jgi:hypothetical protein
VWLHTLKFGAAEYKLGCTKNNGARVCALKFGVAWCKVVMQEKFWCMGVHTGNAQKNLVHGCAHW